LKFIFGNDVISVPLWFWICVAAYDGEKSAGRNTTLPQQYWGCGVGGQQFVHSYFYWTKKPYKPHCIL